MKKNGRAQSSGSSYAVTRARRSRGCTILIFVLACVLTFSFFKGSKEGSKDGAIADRRDVRSLTQEKDQLRLGDPMVGEPESAGDLFYASDLLAKAGKDKPGFPPPEGETNGVDDSAFSKDAEFYASDAVAKAEKEAKLRKGNT
ncbi:hypothetical protein GQ607_016851 [Colletotrichum asianum]|uniref:Uncharacterized protein n=1 Tax=Colletotrichum asianum TaxID=702518 RepID=A0A8H3W099_9PEZI|nr:hypothetical protein GQ607_016851 [Colletotrichum asianum]